MFKNKYGGEYMNKNIIELYKTFLKIKSLGYVKSMRDGVTGIGYTFESLINKQEDNLPIADYKGIEIKAMHRFSKRKIHLFNATPDGDFLLPIKRLVDDMGYPDKEFPKVKILNVSVNTKEYTNIGFYKKLKIKVDYENEKIILLGNKNGKNVDLAISWSFDLIKERIYSKLKYLAVIEVSSKMINDDEYFHYNKIRFFKLRDYKLFIKLIEKGIITITFKVGVFRNGMRVGQTHDRGTDFSINYEDIRLLYKKI